MSADELRQTLDKAGFPATYRVDRDTYWAAYKAVLKNLIDESLVGTHKYVIHGSSGGLLFKNVELLCD